MRLSQKTALPTESDSMRERLGPENDPCPVQQAPHRLRTDPQVLGDLQLPAAPAERRSTASS